MLWDLPQASTSVRESFQDCPLSPHSYSLFHRPTFFVPQPLLIHSFHSRGRCSSFVGLNSLCNCHSFRVLLSETSCLLPAPKPWERGVIPESPARCLESLKYSKLGKEGNTSFPSSENPGDTDPWRARHRSERFIERPSPGGRKSGLSPFLGESTCRGGNAVRSGHFCGKLQSATREFSPPFLPSRFSSPFLKNCDPSLLGLLLACHGSQDCPCQPPFS